jgi:hypothetical protein
MKMDSTDETDLPSLGTGIIIGIDLGMGIGIGIGIGIGTGGRPTR